MIYYESEYSERKPKHEGGEERESEVAAAARTPPSHSVSCVRFVSLSAVGET